MTNIVFMATQVAVHTEKFTDDYSVIGMYFCDEHEAENWNFTKAICDEEVQRVCTVKEVQQFVLDGGIETFKLGRNRIQCVFSENSVVTTRGIRSVTINYTLADDKYSELQAMAIKIFENENGFQLT